MAFMPPCGVMVFNIGSMDMVSAPWPSYIAPRLYVQMFWPHGLYILSPAFSQRVELDVWSIQPRSRSRPQICGTRSRMYITSIVHPNPWTPLLCFLYWLISEILPVSCYDWREVASNERLLTLSRILYQTDIFSKLATHGYVDRTSCSHSKMRL